MWLEFSSERSTVQRNVGGRLEKFDSRWEYGIFVGQIIEEDGKPKMNMDVRWEYELRGLSYE